MYFEIYTTERSRKDPRKAFRRFPSVRRTGKNMYRIQAEERKERKIRRICRRRHYELKRIYPENLGRSDHYRRDFFSYYPRPLAGIWVLRAILGRYEAYWVLRKVFFVALVVGLVFLLNFFS